MDFLMREPTSEADMSKMVQLIFGFDLNKWKAKFPEHEGAIQEDGTWGSVALDKIIKYGFSLGIVEYGLDVWLGPLARGGGLDFTQCDIRVPEMLSLLPPDALAILPVSAYNWHRLDAIVEHFTERGWLGDRRWAVFNTTYSDEPRYNDKVHINNEHYLQFKAEYPEILWITTDTALPLAPNHNHQGIALGDIIIPYMPHHIFETYKYIADDPFHGAFYEWANEWSWKTKERGFYLGGTFETSPDTLDGWVCPYYIATMLGQFGEPDPLVIPYPNVSPDGIKEWVRNQGGKYFLCWTMTDWLLSEDVPATEQTPAYTKVIARPELRQLVLER